jgi:proteasome assembly chaperone (PAC2) family protein
MSVSKKGAKRMEKDLVKIYKTPRLESPSLIVSWRTRDIGKLGSKVIDFLDKKLGCEEIAEMKPSGFFAFGGVRFKNDLVQVQESKFWGCERNNLLIFHSEEPIFQHHQFLSSVLDFTEYYYQANELYTLSGAVSMVAHTHPRRILAVFNQPAFQERLRGYGLEDMTWEGPPAISSYLLWIAKRKGLPGVSLWPEIPFYLADREDPQAIKLVLSFLNKRFDLGLDLGGFDREISDQNERIARLRSEDVEIDQCITRLENGLQLDEEEQLKLTRKVYETLITKE